MPLKLFSLMPKEKEDPEDPYPAPAVISPVQNKRWRLGRKTYCNAW